MTLIFFVFSVPVHGQVFINEICASNSEIITDEDGDYEDWIELYNAGSEQVNLEGFFISDDEANPLIYVLPDKIIEPNGFLLVWVSGKDKVGAGGEIHTNFRLSSEGEPVILSNSEGVVADFVPATALANNMSYGRQSDGSGDFLYFLSPTAGFTNNNAEGAEAFLAPPELLTPSGFYTEDFDLMISHQDAGVELRYTLDGSVPDESSPLYTGPLQIENRLGDPDGISSIPTTSSIVPAWYRWFPPMNPVYKGTSVRVRAFRDGDIPSLTTTGTYIVDPEADSRYDLGRVCITLPEESLLGPAGIYTNFNSTGINWEREAHFELFEADGAPVYASNIGLRLHGGNSRRYAIKSMRLYFRGQYGKTELDYNIFDDEEAPEVQERMILRNSGSEWSRTYFRDAFAQQLLRGYADYDFMNYRPLVSFINGEYWGILNIRERYDDNYIKNNYGYERDEIDMLEGIATPVYGSSVSYNSLRTHWQNADLNNEDNFQTVRDQVDIENFRDHHIHQIFVMNTDQPGKNVRFWKPKAEGGKWRWLLFDLDDTFAFGPHCDYDRNGLVYCTGLDNVNATTANPASNSPAWAPNGPSQTLPLRAMIQSDFFKYDFINRFADLLNTAFLPERLDAIITEFDDRISPYMQEHYERWHRPEPSFRQEHLDLVRTFAENRKGVMEEDMVSFFQLSGSYDLTVDVQPAQGGYVKVNSIAIHPDSVYIEGGGSYPWSGKYYNDVELPISAQAAPDHVFSHWLETGDTSDTLYISPSDDVTYTAVFEPIPTAEPLHYWSFNDGVWITPFFTVGGGSLTANNAVPSVFNFDEGVGFDAANVRFDQPAGDHLRIEQPENVELIFSLPTTGYKSPVFSYEARRSGQGAGRHLISFSTDLVEFVPVDSFEVYNDDPVVYERDFSMFEGVVDNPDFAVRLTITEGEGGTAGNNRFDNVALDAIPFSGGNPPPGISEPLFRLELIAGDGIETIDLNALFSVPDGEALSYEVGEQEGTAADFTPIGGLLNIDPQEAGEAFATILVDDGENSTVELPVEVFVHPTPAPISTFEAFVFTAWDEDALEGSYPEHMIFTEGRYDDTFLDTPLRFAYRIPHDDYHPDDEFTVGFPYNNTRRTRINGLGDEGISFINTGRGRDLGGAIAAVNTEGLEEPIFAWWTAGTVLPNSRVYRLRLQYRIGIEGPFIDVTNGEGDPVEYERNELVGHELSFLNLLLPEEVLDQPYVQFLWRYYYTGEQVIASSGQRAMLRLDDIVIATADFDSVYN
ncbi:MAG: CotH kinase family protein, partial [Cryomorphaceae bacterium]